MAVTAWFSSLKPLAIGVFPQNIKRRPLDAQDFLEGFWFGLVWFLRHWKWTQGFKHAKHVAHSALILWSFKDGLSHQSIKSRGQRAEKPPPTSVVKRGSGSLPLPTLWVRRTSKGNGLGGGAPDPPSASPFQAYLIARNASLFPNHNLSCLICSAKAHPKVRTRPTHTPPTPISQSVPK